MSAHDDRHFRLICRSHLGKVRDDATEAERETCRRITREVEAIAQFQQLERPRIPPVVMPDDA